MSAAYRELRERTFAANLEIPRRGLAIYTFGNASAFDRDRGVLAIKPSGVPYDRLSVDDMVVVDLEGKVVEGDLRPSSDTRTHIVLYAKFRGIGGVVHTRSMYATSWAQTGTPIPMYGTTHADHLAEDVPCTELMSASAVKGDYETETGKQIVECFRGRSPLRTPMVLVAGRGPFAWGEDAEKAVYNAAALEEIARMAFITRTIDPGAPRLPDALVRKHFYRKHGKSAYYGQK
ncbi:L-ribulose-5-phosphate 4-epimerase [Sorangium sp. So ce388]|uniref:L-ribulose-5-phosphate 4-epimerase n=1 Tax=Sorangium cellulosum TaxID=56 RepID=A0A150S5Q0_SORCE|nr:ribulose phosphate epimerase [Sorangium cellulosum]